jgi:lipopolysaccharide/colanic/teichoic acid biosynthesis glycosyltransferase
MIETNDDHRMPLLTISVAGVVICFCLLFLFKSESPGFSKPGLRYGFYPMILFMVSILVYRTLAYRSRGATFERNVRLAFLLSVFLGILAALYRAFASSLAVDFLALPLNITGSFVGMLAITLQTTGLVELNSPPSAFARTAIIEKHRLLLDKRLRGSLIKRAFDISFSLIGLILSFPLWVLLSLAIWLEDPGPLLFAKVCVTKGGDGFKQLKFRSMVKEAEKKTGPILATQMDPRITRIGKLMRKTALDELPQLFNILIGNMSFVGPRPQRTILVHGYLEEMPQYGLRHALRPGLTGVAQVYGSYYATPHQKLRYDLIYVRKQSLWLDLMLILLSFWITLRAKWESREKKI